MTNPLPLRLFTRSQILEYVEAQRRMYANLHRACLPLMGEQAQLLKYGEKVLASLVEEITLGSLDVFLDVSAPTSSERLAKVYKLTHAPASHPSNPVPNPRVDGQDP